MSSCPAQTSTIDGAATIAWFQINPTTGETIGVLEDGGHQGVSNSPSCRCGRYEAATRCSLLTERLSRGDYSLDRFSCSTAAYADLTGEQLRSARTFAAIARRQIAGRCIIGSSALSCRACLEAIRFSSSGGSIPPVVRDCRWPTSTSSRSPGTGRCAVPATSDPCRGQVASAAAVGRCSVQAPERLRSRASSAASWTRAARAASWPRRSMRPGATVSDAHGDDRRHRYGGAGGAAASAGAVSGNGQLQRQRHGQPLVLRPGRDQPRRQRRLADYTATRHGQRLDHAHVPAALTLNGQALPAGTYTITTSSATLSGSGTTSSPNFAGSVSITATDGTINLGPGTGTLSVGGKPLDPDDETTLDGYSGTITVSANGDGTDSVSLNGNAGNVLQVTASPTTLTTDQNTPITFAAQRPDQPRRHLQPHGQRPAGLDGHDRHQRQRHRDARAGAPERHLSDPDHRAVADRPQPRSADHRRGDDHAHAAGHQLHRRARPAVHRALQRRAAPHGLPRHDPEPRPGRRHLQPHVLERPQRLHAPRQRRPASRSRPGRRESSASTCMPNTGQPIPPPGTQLSFTVTATSTTDSSITQTQTETFTVPDDRRRHASPASPTTVNTTPGVAGHRHDHAHQRRQRAGEQHHADRTRSTTGLTVTGLGPGLALPSASRRPRRSRSRPTPRRR